MREAAPPNPSSPTDVIPSGQGTGRFGTRAHSPRNILTKISISAANKGTPGECHVHPDVHTTLDTRTDTGGTIRTNRQITAPKVRLVDQDGNQRGVVSLRQALQEAEDAELDLVEVAPGADPPVCRLADAGKMAYEASVKARASKRNQVKNLVKEIKFRTRIDEHDYDTKLRHVRRFLDEGDRVKITVMFRGREQSHPELGRRILERLSGDISDHGSVEGSIRQEGRNMLMLLTPKKS